ncbi:MAG: 30S ribosomal protein S20 [Pseudobdellovibrio sp.]
MAQHKSAAKRARQSTRKNAVNTARKSTVRSSEKTLLKALKDKDLKTAQTLLSNYMSKMMKAAQKGAFSKQTASRKVARLSTQIHKALSK